MRGCHHYRGLGCLAPQGGGGGGALLAMLLAFCHNINSFSLLLCTSLMAERRVSMTIVDLWVHVCIVLDP